MNCRVWLFAAAFTVLAVEWSLAASVFMGRAPDIQGGIGSCGSFTGMFQPGNTGGNGASRNLGFTVQFSFQPDAADIPANGARGKTVWEFGGGSNGHSILLADNGAGPQLHFLAKDNLTAATAVPPPGTWTANNILNINHPTVITAGTLYEVILIFDPDAGTGLLDWTVNGVNITPTGAGSQRGFRLGWG